MAGKRRKKRPSYGELHQRQEGSGAVCSFCGHTTNVSHDIYHGMCRSCYLDFQEDDILIDLFEAVPA